jgi:putative aminopeptidase FrvX
MEYPALLETARAILSQPTAPFHEDAVRTEIFLQLAQLPHVHAAPDAFGNIIAIYRRGTHEPRFALAAHMDHPAYVYIGTEGDKSLLKTSRPITDESPGWKFLGGVPGDYRAKHPPTRDFGAFAMWDLPAFELREGLLHSRACDDLIGCVAIIETFRQLEAANAECAVYGIFTRAEEVGFVGAIQLARSGELGKDVTIISLETSSAKGGPATMGGGPIIRVGDRTSIFDCSATAQLVQLAKKAGISVQRLLMQGGTCEATAYQLYGYRTAGLCVALGNYHNCGDKTEIAAEYVSLADVEGLVQLCTAIASTDDPGDPLAALRSRLEKEVESYRPLWGVQE